MPKVPNSLFVSSSRAPDSKTSKTYSSSTIGSSSSSDSSSSSSSDKCEQSCTEISSTSSISMVERCVKYEPKCCLPTICKPCPGAFEAYEIYGKYKDSVATVTSVFILEGSRIIGVPVNGTTPLQVGGRIEVRITVNGSLIHRTEDDEHHHDKKKNKCRCTGKCRCVKKDCDDSARLLVPAHAVFAPAAISSAAVIYPYPRPLPDSLGQIRNEYVAASRILATLNNVNYKGKSFDYNCILEGAHPSGDHAYLEISFRCGKNNHCDKIEKCHRRLGFGKSKKACPGTKVVMLGNFTSSQSDLHHISSKILMVEGEVADNKYGDPTGTFLYEALVVNAPAYAYRSGMPILNLDGRIIAMQTLNVAGAVPAGAVNAIGNGLVGGPSQRSMKRAYEVITTGIRLHHTNAQLRSVCFGGGNGQYYIFTPGWLGFAYRLLDGSEFDYTTDWTSGVAPLGLPRTRLDKDGSWVNMPTRRHVRGVMVTGLAGANPNDAAGVANGYIYVPGGEALAPLPASLPESPLLGVIFPGDIITKIGVQHNHSLACTVGNLDHQELPSILLWDKTFREVSVHVTWLKGGNVLNNLPNDEEYENYTRCDERSFCAEEMPAVLDYPYASIGVWRNLSAELVFPATQIQHPLLPALNTVGAGHFSPAV